ncbi:MAG: hypothetical protein KF819_28995 [Labilithrix sp.]|nr:hypothetical protein [Labilithrix sp.]
MRWRRLAAAILFLGPAACGRSCGCVEGEKSYETLDGKVKVELVRKVRWTGGRIPGPMTAFYLRIHTTPIVEHRISCDRVDMAEDDTGKLVAWRCKSANIGAREATWSVLRLRGDARYIVDCDAPVGDANAPDFARLDPLSRAAGRIVRCIDPAYGAREEGKARWSELARAIDEDHGPDALAAFFVEAAELPHVGPHEDPWRITLAGQSSTVAEKVSRSLCPSLSRGDASAPVYVRAAERCPLDAPGVGAGAVAQLRAALQRHVRGAEPSVAPNGGAPQADALLESNARALFSSAAIGVTRAPAEAGAAACASAQALSNASEAARDALGRPGARSVAASVLAATKTKCDAAKGWLDPPPCSASLDCDGGLCSASDLDVDLDAWTRGATAELDGGARETSIVPPSGERALLAFAYAQGALDREIVVRNARRRYAWPDDQLVRCDDEAAANGTPCTCTASLTPWVYCAVDAGTTRTSHETCAFHFDDANRRIDDVRRKCEAPGARCSGRGSCCDGLDCRLPAEGGGLYCQPKRARDGAAAQE